jgi:polyphosphate kinase
MAASTSPGDGNAAVYHLDQSRPAAAADKRELRQPFINRELSLLEFNRRVLAQAEDTRTPALERLRFLCIVSSNLDEFYEVRVACLKEEIRLHRTLGDSTAAQVRQVLALVSAKAHELVRQQYRLFNEVLIPELSRHGVRFLRRPFWTTEQAAWISEYYHQQLMPVLSPLGLDPSHPFPRLLNKSLNFAVELDGKDAFGRNSGTAIVQAPRALPRVIRIPSAIAGCEYGFVFLSSVLHAHVSELFPGMNVRGCFQFRVTRNSELFVDEEEITNLRLALQGELPQRHFGDAVRLEVADNCPPEMTAFLQKQFGLADSDVFSVNGPVNLVRLLQVPDWVDRPDLKYPPFRPSVPPELVRQPDIFRAISAGDILLHHPFQSFAPVVEFIAAASRDPQVVAIKQTVYRAGHDSALLQALIVAARAGKEVTVVVELMARFDEEANIGWATQLEEVGAHVVYGVVAHKTHAKMAMVVRREDGQLKRYVHLATGNYHAKTTKLYTDFGLLTCQPEIASDVASIFIELTGLGRPIKLRHLWQAPFDLHQQLVTAIEREAAHAGAGRKALIIAKMNALLEPKIIEALYQASSAGVRIELIVRGACALRPGIPGLSENIRVRSVIGRFLEHTRVFYFYNDKAKDIYLSSADWMERNFFRRIEVCFPVLNRKLKKRVYLEGLKAYLKDNTEAWEMDADGNYTRCTPKRRRPFSAQQFLLATLGNTDPEQTKSVGI